MNEFSNEKNVTEFFIPTFKGNKVKSERNSYN